MATREEIHRAIEKEKRKLLDRLSTSIEGSYEGMFEREVVAEGGQPKTVKAAINWLYYDLMENGEWGRLGEI
jgi:hypothetical protein